VRTPQTLDPALYEPGTLITLTGAVNGHEVRLTEGREYDYPTFLLTELYLWHSPFRYGLHSNAAPLFPDFVGHDDDPRRNPYAHGYNPYPYTQYWYRNGGN